MDQGIPFSSLTSATSVANADELLLQQSGVTKRLTYEKLRGPIDTDAGNSIDLSINEDTASLTATLKNKAGTTLNSKSVGLPNTSNINMEVDEDTAELTVQLKNKSGAVVTEDTVTLPNTSNLEMSINSSNVLTTSLKNKSGQVVTSDSVTIPAVQCVNLTLAEYEALPDTKLTDGVYYNIIESNEVPEDETINGNKNFTGNVKVKGNEVATYIYEKEQTVPQGNTLDVDISSFAEGMYLVSAFMKNSNKKLLSILSKGNTSNDYNDIMKNEMSIILNGNTLSIVNSSSYTSMKASILKV